MREMRGVTGGLSVLLVFTEGRLAERVAGTGRARVCMSGGGVGAYPFPNGGDVSFPSFADGADRCDGMRETQPSGVSMGRRDAEGSGVVLDGQSS